MDLTIRNVTDAQRADLLAQLGGTTPGGPAGWSVTVNGSSHADLPATGGTVRLHIGGGTPADAKGEWYVDGKASGLTAADADLPVPANTGSAATSHSIVARVTANGQSVDFGPLTVTVAAASAGVEVIEIDWTTPKRVTTVQAGNAIYAFATTTGNLPGVANNASRFDGAEWPGGTGGTCRHEWSLSTIPGDMSAPLGPNGGNIAGGSLGFTQPFLVGVTASGVVTVPTSTRVYLNVRNVGDPAQTYGVYCDLTKNGAP